MGPLNLDDVALALGTAVAQTVATVMVAHRLEGDSVDAGGVVLLIVGPLALLVRRSHPAAALGLAYAATLAYFALGNPGGPAHLALVVAIFNAIINGRRLLGWIALVSIYPLAIVVEPSLHPEQAAGIGLVLGVAAWVVVLGVVAELLRLRRDRALEAERTHREEARRQAGEERLRIARELHDVLAHNISLISVQAGVALHLVDEKPDQTREALTTIRSVSREALLELRTALDALRQPGEPAPHAPSAGMDRIGELIGRTRDAGLPVDAEIEGDPTSLPAGIDLAAYRIVQEALTNVTRHAAGADTSVRLSYRPDELVVQIDNHAAGGEATVETSGGNGIPGMSERARALGGRLQAGPRPGGGFRVLARLPIPAPE
jgi:signal transduction histidine kinase